MLHISKFQNITLFLRQNCNGNAALVSLTFSCCSSFRLLCSARFLWTIWFSLSACLLRTLPGFWPSLSFEWKCFLDLMLLPEPSFALESDYVCITSHIGTKKTQILIYLSLLALMVLIHVRNIWKIMSFKFFSIVKLCPPNCQFSLSTGTLNGNLCLFHF